MTFHMLHILRGTLQAALPVPKVRLACGLRGSSQTALTSKRSLA